ncbi:MAG: excinuclease ABC subunit UvrB [Candidatus Kerfeldbacteria bacterium]|nr:excinuclease ABC subunit UvrB [Candidatus Kerfeldbacteria bacterium]
MDFQLRADFKPTGDQPRAIDQLTTGLHAGQQAQTLLGVTGSGKTFTVANVIANVQRPTLLISHNKTLAAQLASELKSFFPNNAVHYFVSFYDYYQPESYIPRTDTYIEKTTALNEEISRLRHAATQALLSRRDVIVVASVSCIYGLGSPVTYGEFRLQLQAGQSYDRRTVLQQLVAMQYHRNDIAFIRGTFRVKGEVIEVFPAMADQQAYRLRYDGNVLEQLELFDVLTGTVLEQLPRLDIFPATHYIAPLANRAVILKQIEDDLEHEVAKLQHHDKLLEAQRLQQRTKYDVELLRETGYVNGIENYSRYFDERQPGQPPYTLLDYFPKDFLMVIDESHMTIPQITGMYRGDQARKQTLVNYGFRLQAALDNRPLQFEEFNQYMHQVIFISATPGPYELQHAQTVAEQLIRPTGLLDPIITIQSTNGQIDHLITEIKQRIDAHERVLVTTLTKRMAETLTEFLQERHIAVQYLHSEIDTLERLEILRDLRLGVYDVVVGINLLREGLDLPEVSLVAILDADKEGFLRSTTALIQTIGRAARHNHGSVVMYADTMTDSMQRAIDETNRRRAIQQQYNTDHGITPRSIIKAVGTDRLAGQRDQTADTPAQPPAQLSKEERRWWLHELEEQMELAAQNLEFEQAAHLRDEIKRLKLQKIK